MRQFATIALLGFSNSFDYSENEHCDGSRKVNFLPALLAMAFLAPFTMSGCADDPILARADEERAEEIEAGPSSASGDGVTPPPGATNQPSPGQAAVPVPADPSKPPPGAPAQPAPGIPEEPQPAAPGAPGGAAIQPETPDEGPTTVLSGEVRYADYRRGPVRIDIFDGDQRDFSARPRVVGKAELSGPGAFEITVPRSVGEVWISAFNDADSDNKPDQDDPTGFCAGNPVQLDRDEIGKLVIELEYNPPPEGK